MSSSTATHPLSAGRYGRTIARRWLVVVLSALIGLAVAAGYLVLRPPMATASALVNLNVISQEPFDAAREPSGLIDAETENQAARSSTVLARAAEELGGTSAAELRTGLEVNMLPNATVLRISYTAPTVEEATAGADTVAEEFLTYRTELADARVQSIVDRLTERRNLLRDDLRRLDEEISGAPPNSVKASQARGDRDVLATELSALLAQSARLGNVDTTGGTVLTRAADVGAYVSPQPWVVLAAGLLAGLLLGLVGAFVRDRLDRRVLDSTDLEALDSGPALARISARAAVPATGAVSEALRCVWERLDAGLISDRPILAVLDLGARAPYRVAANLASVVADSADGVQLILVGSEAEGLQRLAVELDLREVGTFEDVVAYQSAARPGVRVRWISDEQDHAGQLRALERVLGRQQGRGRPRGRTVVAVPMSAGRSFRMACGRLVDATVVVVPERDVRKDRLRELREDLAAVGGTHLGAVLLHGRPLAAASAGRSRAHEHPTLQPAGSPAADQS